MPAAACGGAGGVGRVGLRPARLEDLAHEVAAGLQVFFFNDTATTEIYTLSLHDALPICEDLDGPRAATGRDRAVSQVAVAVGILELDARDGARRVVAEVAIGGAAG